MILENVWGPDYRDEVNYLKVYAYRIRRKLGDERGLFLQSDPSVGYRLAPPGESACAGRCEPRCRVPYTCREEASRKRSDSAWKRSRPRERSFTG